MRRWKDKGPHHLQVRDLDDSLLGQTVTLFGRVADADIKEIRIRVAVFRCSRCGRVGEEVQTTDQLKFPLTCSHSWGGCGAKRREARFKLLERESVYDERQKILVADDKAGDHRILGLLRGELAGTVPIGAQGVFTGILRSRSGRLARGELPFQLEVAALTDVRMPADHVLYPRKVDPMMIWNIIVELQREGLPTTYTVVVKEAAKIGLAEDDVRAMLHKLLSEGKLEGQEARKRPLREEGEDEDEDEEAPDD